MFNCSGWHINETFELSSLLDLCKNDYEAIFSWAKWMSWWYKLESMRQWCCGQNRTLLLEREGGYKGNIWFFFKTSKIPFCSKMSDKFHVCLPSIPCQNNHNHMFRSNLLGRKDNINYGWVLMSIRQSQTMKII